MKLSNSLFGATLLVAGTCIGAGMLGLPVMTAAAGFYPTLAAFCVVWVFMNLSAMTYLEVSLRFKGETNLISIIGKTLGKRAKILAWLVVVLLLYSLMAAYTAGGTTMFMQITGLQTSTKLAFAILCCGFMLPFAVIVYSGAVSVDLFNRILMAGLILSFIYICVSFSQTSTVGNLHSVGESKYLLCALPLIVTSFGFQNLIPTLKTYLNEDVKKLRLAIWLGTLIPFIVYAAWELITLRLIPTWGEGGLVSIMHSKGDNPADAMIELIKTPGSAIHLAVFWFSFFTLTSSVIGMGLGISDFLADGLKIHKTRKGKMILSALTFAPPVLYTVLYPQGFLYALNYAGIFSALLLIVFPVLMAWSARYRLKLPGHYRMWGGKTMLILVLVFGLLVVGAEVFRRLELFPIPYN